MDKLTNKQIRTTLREIELYELRGQNSIDCGEHEQAIKEFGNAISYLRVLVENLYADKNQEIRQMSKTLFCRVVYPETFQFEVPDNWGDLTAEEREELIKEKADYLLGNGPVKPEIESIEDEYGNAVSIE